MEARINSTYSNHYTSNKIANQIASLTKIDNSILLKDHKSSIKDKAFSTLLLNHFAKNYHKPNFTHVELANTLFISHRHLHRRLISSTGMNFSQLLRKYRLTIAISLCHSDLQIMQISEKVGFSSCSYFTKCFKEEFGITPKKYQAQKV